MVKSAMAGVEYTPKPAIRPGSVMLNVSLTYFASPGPRFALTRSEVSSWCAILCHCALSIGDLVFEVATVTSPFAPLLRNETLLMFSIRDREINKVVLPLAKG